MVVPDGTEDEGGTHEGKETGDLPVVCFSAEGKFLDGEGSFSRRVRGRV